MIPEKLMRGQHYANFKKKKMVVVMEEKEGEQDEGRRRRKRRASPRMGGRKGREKLPSWPFPL